jgi:uncharacterized membrane protein YkoI
MTRIACIVGVTMALISASAVSALADEDVMLDQVPAKAKATIGKQVANGRIDDIDRELRNGEVVYEVEYRDDSGAEYEIVVAADGRILHRQRED